MRADTAGHNAPDLEVPPEEDQGEAAPAASTAGEEASGDVWGDEAAAEPAAEAPAGGDGGDIWGEEGGDAATPAGPGGEFSDAMAIQLPVQMPAGARRPYFLFGDSQNPVDLWFVDLATKVATRYNGAGSEALSLVEGEDVTAVASYDRGEWSVILKRSLRATGGITFAEGQFVPVAFSLWDGAQRERGNKRGLTRWMYLYTTPKETPSAFGPMIRAALGVLVVDMLLIAWVRRRQAVTAKPAGPTENDREVPLHV
jgi:hypothetical protein